MVELNGQEKQAALDLVTQIMGTASRINTRDVKVAVIADLQKRKDKESRTLLGKIQKMPIRQFHAMFPLQVRRNAAMQQSSARKRRRRRRPVNREVIRQGLVKFARNLLGAEGPAVVDLLTGGVDALTNEIVPALGLR